MKVEKLLVGVSVIACIGFTSNAMAKNIHVHIPHSWQKPSYEARCDNVYDDCVDRCESGSKIALNRCISGCEAAKLNCERDAANKLKCAKEYKECMRYTADDKDLIEDCRDQFRKCRRNQH